MPHKAACYVEILDDRGRIMMLALGEAVSVGVMEVDAVAVGAAMTTGYMAEVYVSAANGAFLGGGPAAKIMLAPSPYVVEGQTITMRCHIGPQHRQEAPTPRRRKPMSIVEVWLRLLIICLKRRKR